MKTLRSTLVATVVVISCLAAPGVFAVGWQELSPSTAPSARYGHTMATVGDDVYLFGGSSFGMPGGPSSELWRWDRSAQTWVEVAASNTPPGRYYHGSASANGKLYIGYGYGISEVLGDFWEYDPVTNAWREITVSGPAPHSIGGMVDLGDGRVFIAGGYPASGSTALATSWILDLSVLAKTSGLTAQQISSMPRGIYGFVPASTGGRPTVIGGYLTKSAGYTADILVWEISPEPLGQWVSVIPTGSTPLGRTLAASVVWRPPNKDAEWGEDVLIFGGESSDKLGYTTSTQIYETATGAWSYGPDMPVALSSHAAAILPPAAGENVQVLMFGGISSSGTVDWTFLCTTGIVVETPCGDANTLCLNDDRFEVQASFDTGQGQSGLAQAEKLTGDTGYFWFFNEDNVEVVVKVLDACTISGKFWVFGAGLTNVEVTLTITDTETDEVKVYTNTQGTDFQPIQDTSAFASCPKGSRAEASGSDPLTWPTDARTVAVASDLMTTLHELNPAPWQRSLASDCTADADTLCLNSGRFQVEATYATSQGQSGAAQVEALTGDTGYFWFFNEDNVEVVIKVLKACGFNNHYWVFSAGLTNVEVDITVTDTETDTVMHYSNPQETAYQPDFDTSAFATCP